MGFDVVEPLLKDVATRDRLFDWLLAHPDRVILSHGLAAVPDKPLPFRRGTHLAVLRDEVGPLVVELDTETKTKNAIRRMHRKTTGGWTEVTGPVPRFPHMFGETSPWAFAGEVVVTGDGRLCLDPLPAGDLDALLAAVLRTPKDRDARIAYAEALGDVPRAQIIHDQLGTNRRVRGRERDLYAAHKKAWLTPIAHIVDDAHMVRGFFEYIWADASKLVAHADELWAATPALDLNLKNCKPVLAELFACPHLSKVRSLQLSQSGLDDADMRVIAASPNLGSLRWLSLSHNRIGRDGIFTLAAAPNLRKVLFVDFVGNPVNPVPRVLKDGETVTGVERTEIADEIERVFGTIPWMLPVDEGGPRHDFYTA